MSELEHGPGDGSASPFRLDRAGIAILLGATNLVAVLILGVLVVVRTGDEPEAPAPEARRSHPGPPSTKPRTLGPRPSEAAEHPAGGKVSSPLEPREGPERRVAIDLGNGMMLDFVYVPPGRFLRGAGAGVHVRVKKMVAISKGFHIGKYEVTQAQYELVMGKNPSKHKGPDRPVELMYWRDVDEFCTRLSIRTGRNIRLPTEAEWEYACRAGSLAEFCFGHDEAKLGDYAWHRENSGRETHPVGKKLPNAWGLYDMHGNVSEFCSDWHDKGYYETAPTVDPTGPEAGEYKVVRGGSYSLGSTNCQCGVRWRASPNNGHADGGFRVVMGPAPPVPPAPPADDRRPRDPRLKRLGPPADVGEREVF